MEVNRELRRLGWTVLRVWEHSFKRPQYLVNRIIRLLKESGKDACNIHR
jgi:G:T-mismatch repair DNA endonuclease (very short patch repair protein)